jgi:hypothetical protein
MQWSSMLEREISNGKAVSPIKLPEHHEMGAARRHAS